jgi:protein-S-isoprenylcysteine O-methyltransferase Ste14
MLTLMNAFRTLVWGAAFLTMWGWLALASRRYDRAFGGALPAWMPWLGVPFLIAGIALTATCVYLFVVRGHGTPAPFDAPKEFVAVGPYRRVRNPMYLGGLAMLVGAALINRSPAMLAFTLVPAVCLFMFVKTYEERTLEKRFGDSYRAYKRSVPGWLPRSGSRQP